MQRRNPRNAESISVDESAEMELLGEETRSEIPNTAASTAAGSIPASAMAAAPASTMRLRMVFPSLRRFRLNRCARTEDMDGFTHR